MSQPVGDLVIDLSLDAVRFDEQMSRVRRHFQVWIPTPEKPPVLLNRA